MLQWFCLVGAGLDLLNVRAYKNAPAFVGAASILIVLKPLLVIIYLFLFSMNHLPLYSFAQANRFVVLLSLI